jgi:hypothetical protein
MRRPCSTSSISCFQSSCMVWKLSCGVCVNAEWTMVSRSWRISSNEGRRWGSGHQQAVKTELSLQDYKTASFNSTKTSLSLWQMCWAHTYIGHFPPSHFVKQHNVSEAGPQLRTLDKAIPIFVLYVSVATNCQVLQKQELHIKSCSDKCTNNIKQELYHYLNN